MRNRIVAILVLTGVADARADRLYFTDFFGGAVRRMDLATRQVETVVDEITSPIRLAVDEAGGAVYWTAGGPPDTRGVYRANLDGGGVQRIAPAFGTPLGIGLDAQAGMVYWNDFDGGFHRVRLHDLDVETVAQIGGPVQDFTLDLDSQGAYLSEYSGSIGSFGAIQRVSLIDGAVQEVVSDIQNGPVGVGLDAARGHFYYGRYNFHPDRDASLERSDLDGGNRVTIVPKLDVDALSLDLARGRIFFTTLRDDNTGAVFVSGLDGAGMKTLLDVYAGGVFYVPEPSAAALAVWVVGVFGIRARFGRGGGLRESPGR
jgi:hypothetical protein